MTSKTVKQLIRAAMGVLYAFAYGLWTMLPTGGGHGNFIWFMVFFFVEFFGLYFPIMAALSVDLRSRTTKLVFGSLILFNLIGSLVLIGGWIFDTSDKSSRDFANAWERGNFSFALFCVFIHFLPTIFFAFQLIKAMYSGTDSPDEDQMVTLDLD